MNSGKLEDDSFIDVRITTKAREENVPPFQTRCWTSIGKSSGGSKTINKNCLLISNKYI